MVLLAGDILAFLLALWLTLFSRRLQVPDWATISQNLPPYLLLFILWLIVFFAADLYGRQTILFKKKLPRTILNAQIANILLAVLFFYVFPFGIAPKTNLVLYLVWSFLIIVFWRRFLFAKIYRPRKESLLFLCSGSEVEEVKAEFQNDRHYNVKVLADESAADLAKSGASLVVVNLYDHSLESSLPGYYAFFRKGGRFVNFDELYEQMFNRVPLGLINERWFLENVSNDKKPFYTFAKRAIDLVLAFILGLISLVFYPFVWLAIKLEDRGPIFIAQERIGQNGKQVRIYKFRTMTGNDNGKYGQSGATSFKITRVGRFLRPTRIDELPQLWNVWRGDISLIGPRLELPSLVKQYEQEIPFYSIRHLIAPGLSGWAQIYQENHPHSHVATEATREKLSYDLFYIKNRSLWLDLTITLRTIKTLLSRSGI